jgi:hypothetical protein
VDLKKGAYTVGLWALHDKSSSQAFTAAFRAAK